MPSLSPARVRLCWSPCLPGTQLPSLGVGLAAWACPGADGDGIQRPLVMVGASWKDIPGAGQTPALPGHIWSQPH